MSKDDKRNCKRIEVTKNNVLFRKGKLYSYERKFEVGNCYNALFQLHYSNINMHKYPSALEVAKKSKMWLHI